LVCCVGCVRPQADQTLMSGIQTSVSNVSIWLFMPAVNTCTDLLNDVDNLISYNVNSLKWTGDCFYGLEAFIEALTDQVIYSSEAACAEACIIVQS